jgi:hypothetical protein
VASGVNSIHSTANMLLQGKIAEGPAHTAQRKCFARHNVVRPHVPAAAGRVRRGLVHAGAVGSPVREAAGRQSNLVNLLQCLARSALQEPTQPPAHQPPHCQQRASVSASCQHANCSSFAAETHQVAESIMYVHAASRIMREHTQQ